MSSKINTAYIQGRPHGHPAHNTYAESVNAVFHYVDSRLRYHDVPNASALRRYLSWIVCALTFPKKRTYDVFLSEEAYFMLGLMRKMRVVNRRQKLIAIMGSHTLYYIHTNQYSPSTKKAFLYLFKSYDAFICEGLMQFELLTNFLGKNHHVKIYQIFNGSPIDRFNKLIQIEPNLSKLNILTIAAIPNQNRTYYKGIDLMLYAFAKIKKVFPNTTFTIVGEYDPILMQELLEKTCPLYKNDVVLTGQSNDLSICLKDACLYLHTARGEAWGISVTEAMAAGVVPIVSEWTGSKEAVGKVSENLIVPLDVNLIAEKIIWYLNLPLGEKKELSDQCKKVSAFYTEPKAVENFKAVFNKAYHEITSC